MVVFGGVVFRAVVVLGGSGFRVVVGTGARRLLVLGTLGTFTPTPAPAPAPTPPAGVGVGVADVVADVVAVVLVVSTVENAAELAVDDVAGWSGLPATPPITPRATTVPPPHAAIFFQGRPRGGVA